MNLSHQQDAPTPRSPTWWLLTSMLLCLGAWQRVIKSSMHLGGCCLLGGGQRAGLSCEYVVVLRASRAKAGSVAGHVTCL